MVKLELEVGEKFKAKFAEALDHLNAARAKANMPPLTPTEVITTLTRQWVKSQLVAKAREAAELQVESDSKSWE